MVLTRVIDSERDITNIMLHNINLIRKHLF